MPDLPEPTTPSIALFDRRPFFEKALQYGVQHGIIAAAPVSGGSEKKAGGEPAPPQGGDVLKVGKLLSVKLKQ